MSGRKYKVDHYYALKVEEQAGAKVYGWVGVDSIDESKELVYSYPSRSKKFSEERRKAERERGCNMATKEDYVKFFEYFTSHSLDEFYDKFTAEEDFLKFMKEESIEPYNENLFSFMWKLGDFLLNGNTLLTNARGYKIVPQKANEKGEIS